MSTTIFVQEPDYIGFRKTTAPLQPLGVVYDGRDPYATPLGVIFVVLENNSPREVYVPRGTRHENGKIAYTHDLDVARYVIQRNGFEEGQMHVSSDHIAEDSKNLLRDYLQSQNTKEMNGKYLIQVCG
jgi:hypothetical protein